MRVLVYLALVGAAFLLMLLPLRGGLHRSPTWTTAPQAVMAREGSYAQSLRPGESRTYVLELTGHSLLKVRFHGSGSGCGLRIEDGDGSRVGTVDSAVAQDRRLGVVNSSATSQTLYLTVYRPADTDRRKPLLHKVNAPPRFFASRSEVMGGEGTPGAYALELARDIAP